MNVVLVFIGGGLGAACRWLVASQMKSSDSFPWGTLTVNLVGCFLIGLFSYYAIRGHNTLMMLGVIGFLGGFTTFSSYGFELTHMLEGGMNKNFVIYFLSSNVVGILLVYVGHRLASDFIQ